MESLTKLMRRLFTKEQRRFIKFCVVGFSGIPVNLVFTWLSYTWIFFTLAERTRNDLASVFGIAVSIFTNFLLNDLWTWRDRHKRGSTFLGRLLRFYMVCAAAAILQFGASKAARDMLGFHLLLAQFLGIALATVINYFVNNIWTFRSSKADQKDPEPGE